MLHSKRQQAESATGMWGAARGALLSPEIYDELEDEIVRKAMNK